MASSFTLYSRPGCHLCEQAEDLLAAHAPACRVVDVDADEGLRRLYGLRVPVLTRAGQAVLEGRIEEAALLDLLRRYP